MTHGGPIADSYWVEPGRLLAGEYLGSWDIAEAKRKLRSLIEAGVTLFLDLNGEREGKLKPYAPQLNDVGVGGAPQAYHQRSPIPDVHVPSQSEMASILDTIDQAVNQGAVVYVHRYRGIGRTGIVGGRCASQAARGTI